MKKENHTFLSMCDNIVSTQRPSNASHHLHQGKEPAQVSSCDPTVSALRSPSPIHYRLLSNLLYITNPHYVEMKNIIWINVRGVSLSE